MRRLALLTLSLLILPPPVFAPARAASVKSGDAGWPALVVLVRHAEKSTEPADDPRLTPAGEERARALARALKDAGVTAIITSDTVRARETARPLAEARRLTPVVVGFEGGVEAHARAVAAAVRRQAGGVVLVVGHSNTLPLIIETLGGPRLPPIADGEYAHLFTLVMGPAGPRLVQASYGAPDAAAADAPR